MFGQCPYFRVRILVKVNALISSYTYVEENILGSFVFF